MQISSKCFDHVIRSTEIEEPKQGVDEKKIDENFTRRVIIIDGKYIDET